MANAFGSSIVHAENAIDLERFGVEAYFCTEGMAASRWLRMYFRLLILWEKRCKEVEYAAC